MHTEGLGYFYYSFDIIMTGWGLNRWGQLIALCALFVCADTIINQHLGAEMVRKTRAGKQEEKAEGEGKAVVQEEKTQVIQKKPKKYVQKSVDALQRIERSKHQRIFLINASRDSDERWSFLVQGTKGSQYNVAISTTVSCQCFDFKMKKKPCKHIFFIVTQVAQNEELLDYFRSTVAKISKAAYEVLDKQLTERLKSRLNSSGKDAKDIDLKDDTDCTICFTEMDKENEKLEDCGTCKKYFHVMCLDAWKNHNPTCPLCRSTLSHGSLNDPLGKLNKIKID